MLANVSSWIISIAGVICLSVIVELILPDGQINRYIKHIFAFIVVFVIISPIPKFLNKEIDISNLFDYDYNIEVNEDYLYQLNLDKLNALKNDIEETCSLRGYKNIQAYINGDIFQSQMEIKSVNVDLSNLIITQNAEHNDISKIKKDITLLIQKLTDINEEEVRYIG